jgi:hypothetical protein
MRLSSLLNMLLAGPLSKTSDRRKMVLEQLQNFLVNVHRINDGIRHMFTCIIID